MGEGVRGDPGDGLPQHLRLVVDALDGEEDLAGNRATDEGQGVPWFSSAFPGQQGCEGASGTAREGSPLARTHLAQGAGRDDVVEELDGQAPAELDGLNVALARPRESGEEEAHGEGIVQVPQRVYKGWVPASGQEGKVASHPAPEPPETSRDCSNWWRSCLRKEQALTATSGHPGGLWGWGDTAGQPAPHRSLPAAPWGSGLPWEPGTSLGRG